MIVVVFILILGKGVRKGKELKAPYYASTVIYNYITVHDIISNKIYLN